MRLCCSKRSHECPLIAWATVSCIVIRSTLALILYWPETAVLNSIEIAGALPDDFNGVLSISAATLPFLGLDGSHG